MKIDAERLKIQAELPVAAVVAGEVVITIISNPTAGKQSFSEVSASFCMLSAGQERQLKDKHNGGKFLTLPTSQVPALFCRFSSCYYAQSAEHSAPQRPGPEDLTTAKQVGLKPVIHKRRVFRSAFSWTQLK